MKHVFANTFTAGRRPEPEVLEHEAAVRLFIGRMTAMVDELESCATAVASDSPATARHLRLVAQQMSGFALTALETWPKAKI